MNRCHPLPGTLGSTGICLIEVMIAAVAGAVVLWSTLQSLDHFQRRLWNQITVIDREQELRIGLKILSDELRLAGTGSTPAHPSLLRAESQQVEFWASLDGLVTTLAQPASAGVMQLVVNDGKDWAKGKRILVCEQERCGEGRLSRAGQQNLLSLAEPLSEPFAAGDSVILSNTVRYYLGTNREGQPTLMREVDGGANPLITGVSHFGLTYLDRSGTLTSNRARISRVRIELAVDREPRVISEVGLRGQT